MLRAVERFPALVYVGSGVLVLTAAKMIGSEQTLREVFAPFEHATPLLYVLVPAVLWAGFVRNHRKLASRIHARLAGFAQRLPEHLASEGGQPTLRVSYLSTAR